MSKIIIILDENETKDLDRELEAVLNQWAEGQLTKERAIEEIKDTLQTELNIQVMS